MLKIVIVEDEFPSAQYLRKLIQDCEPGSEVIAHVSSVEAGLAWFEADNPAPDLIFSDVELSDGTSFEIWERHTPNCPIVFTTAHDHYHQAAFDSNGVDYLLKPFDSDGVRKSFEKYRRLQRGLWPDQVKTLDALKASLERVAKPAAERYRRRFAIKRYNGMELIEVASIALFRLDQTGLFGLDGQGKAYPMHDYTLSSLEEQLDPANFFRVNRNEIINIDFVSLIQPFDKDKLKINLGKSLECVTSSHKTPQFRRWLENN